jgi:hypothetical protein
MSNEITTTDVEPVIDTEGASESIIDDVKPDVNESTSGAPFQLDDYEQRIESLLSNHENSKKTKIEEEEANEALREGESWQSVLESSPDNVQRAMASLRADYTRKTQALAEERKELARQQQALTNSEAYQKLQEMASVDAELDPFEPDSFNNYINKVVAERLSSILEPMRQEQMQFQAQTKLESFMQEHPELKTDQEIRREVHQTLSNNENLDLEAAYWIVQGRRAKAQQKKQQAQVNRTKKAARSAGLTVGSGRKSGPTIPKDERMGAWDIYEHLLQQK